MSEVQENILCFDLAFKECKVEFRDPATNAKTKYILREFAGGEREKHMSDTGKRISIGADGTPSGMKNFEGYESGLIARCLFEITASGERRVDIKTIQAFPSSIQEALAKKARLLCGLEDEESEDEAKNDD